MCGGDGGGPGGPGDAPGPGGTFGEGTPPGGSGSTIDTIMNMTLPTMMMQGLLYGGSSLFGKGVTFGDIARGDPNPSFGTGPDSIARRRLGLATSPPLVSPLVEPPVVPTPTPKRKKTGRQETILTSGLSEAQTLKPTLLGQ